MSGNQIEGNIEIAKFVGASIVETEGKLKGLWYLERTFPNGNHYARPDQLIYHSSWDWLMPVYKKCYDIWRERLDGGNKSLADDFENIWDALWKADIKTCHQEIVQFITQSK